MKKFNLKDHNAKMLEFSKNAARGTYPSKRVAKTGSMIGIAIGITLLLIGTAGTFWGSVWSMGSLFAGVTTVISNVLNLKRIK